EGIISLNLTAGTTPSETVMIRAEGLGTYATASYGIGETDDIFEITVPEQPFSEAADGTDVAVTVHAGGLVNGDIVVISTSFGTWAESAGKTVYHTITNDPLPPNDPVLDINLNLSSMEAGVATIQAYKQDDATIADMMRISFYHPASKAYYIIIDASSTLVLPNSTSTMNYSSTIKAKVYDINWSPVQDAVVDFSLSNTTGGGEYLSPVSVITDSVGNAETTFTSGTLGTGSDPDSAVLVTARVSTPAGCTDETTDITCVSNVTDSLDGTYFTLSRTGTDYYIWYNTGAGAGDPSVVGTGIQVALGANNTAAGVALLTQTAIDAITGFSVSRLGAVLTIVTCGDVTDAADGVLATGFTFNTTTQGTGLEWRSDTVPIIISGAVANISIGYSTAQTSSEDETLYELPISLIVADTNGNPVAGAVVSLGLKPSRFRTGYWKYFYNFLLDERIWFIVYSNPDNLYEPSDSPGGVDDYESDPVPGTAIPYIFLNEDLNNDAILNGNEDEVDRYTAGYPAPTGWPYYFTGYLTTYTYWDDVSAAYITINPFDSYVPGLNDGILTPGQSVAGVIPSTVTTDSNGVASFMLTYQKQYANWVEDQITATTMVFGTEYITKSRKWKPSSLEDYDAEIIQNAFPYSPFWDLGGEKATTP
ncbi:hypothetical protein KAH55_07770, partial [bacterium]|nr:hypothetical protein [bacterium]